MTKNGTAVLTKTDAGIEVAFDGAALATIKDGARIAQRADEVLANAAIYRAEGFNLRAGNLSAAAVQFL